MSIASEFRELLAQQCDRCIRNDWEELEKLEPGEMQDLSNQQLYDLPDLCLMLHLDTEDFARGIYLKSRLAKAIRDLPDDHPLLAPLAACHVAVLRHNEFLFITPGKQIAVLGFAERNPERFVPLDWLWKWFRDFWSDEFVRDHSSRQAATA